MIRIQQKPLSWFGDSLDVVLHTFEKKTPKTSKADIDLASTRYRQLVNVRMKK